jgi:hypothetical protein
MDDRQKCGQIQRKEGLPFYRRIDTHENELFFVCRKLCKLCALNLDDGIYTRTSTRSGLFNDKPNQLQRIIDDPRAMLCFAEEGGSNSGVQVRDDAGRFYSILCRSGTYRLRVIC